MQVVWWQVTQWPKSLLPHAAPGVPQTHPAPVCVILSYCQPPSFFSPVLLIKLLIAFSWVVDTSLHPELCWQARGCLSSGWELPAGLPTCWPWCCWQERAPPIPWPHPAWQPRGMVGGVPRGAPGRHRGWLRVEGTLQAQGPLEEGCWGRIGRC